MSKQCFGKLSLPLSSAVRAGDWVYISGQVPVDESGNIVAGGISEQTHQVMENLRSALALAGCALSDVVKTHCYLTNRDDFAAFNAVYGKYFPDNPPARTTAEARLMIDIAVEVEAIAYKPAAAAQG